MGAGRAGQGPPKLETGSSRRCPAAPQQPRLCPPRERGAERAAHARRGPAGLRLLLFLCIQGSSYYLYLTLAVKALLSPAS